MSDRKNILLIATGGTIASKKSDNGLKDELTKMGVKFYIDSPTNQQFPILPDAVLAELKKKYSFAYQERMDETHSAVRFCTCWATKEENVDMLLADIRELLA